MKNRLLPVLSVAIYASGSIVVFALLVMVTGCGSAACRGASQASSDEAAPAASVVPTSAPEMPATITPDARPIQVAPGRYEGLPAVSADGQQIAIATNPAFSGIAIHQYVVIIDVAAGRIVGVFRTYQSFSDEELQVDAVNELLYRGRFASLTSVAETVPEPGEPGELSSSSEFVTRLAYRDPVDVEAPVNRRGMLVEGFQTIELRVEASSSGREWWVPAISYSPPTFSSIPANCRASFFPAVVRIWGSSRHPALLVEQVWRSGSDECFPWRFLLLHQREADGPSRVSIIEESQVLWAN